MADYLKGIRPVLKIEGGWCKVPGDSGGETYKGISRVNWPNWSGWRIIDTCRKDPNNFPKNLYSNPTLNELVIGFYKLNFWDKIGGDGIRDQAIADLLIDSAVNEGVKPAVRRAQTIIGLPATGVIDQLLIERLNSL